VKNKTLFPLIKEKEVLFFTLLEGEVIKGIITDFTKYELSISLKGGLPLTILRHSIYDIRNKKGRCFMKKYQQKHKDWKQSELFVS
jgi:DNA-directed RNA polymerase subunit E'/Rpb7